MRLGSWKWFGDKTPVAQWGQKFCAGCLLFGLAGPIRQFHQMSEPDLGCLRNLSLQYQKISEFGRKHAVLQRHPVFEQHKLFCSKKMFAAALRLGRGYQQYGDSIRASECLIAGVRAFNEHAPSSIDQQELDKTGFYLGDVYWHAIMQTSSALLAEDPLPGGMRDSYFEDFWQNLYQQTVAIGPGPLSGRIKERYEEFGFNPNRKYAQPLISLKQIYI